MRSLRVGQVALPANTNFLVAEGLPPDLLFLDALVELTDLGLRLIIAVARLKL